MSLTEQLTDYVHAAFSGLWVLTSEPDEAEREIAQHARQRGWKLAAWDIANGLRFPNTPPGPPTSAPATPSPSFGPCPPLPSPTALPCCCCTTSTAS
jgi:hypothetical protein